jgi:GPI ethanolamine phosphate transferase 1
MQARLKLLLLGICFHIVYIASIFDIYFRSPLVHGMEPVDPPTPPAKRLLLAVADGLRADKIFENEMERAPFLKEKIFNQGRWGVSHTRVPTESRPGHVALIAGFYEDVSAVTKGWKMNPVNFDSVFNQSSHTWSFGSPDILPMFAYGASDPHKVEMFMYGAEEEDFAEDDASNLDVWVFEHFEQLFLEAKTNETLSNQLRQDKVVFFLQYYIIISLLGIDTNGHGHRPYSPQYLNNIKLVDQGLKKVEQLIYDFYNDDKTAFVITADHGMSNRGSHGDGNPQNTETPIIAWGAGIDKPNTESPTGHDIRSRDEWKLGSLQRNDVSQADIAPLMSTLIGVPFPLNSVGVLPVEFLGNTEQYKAEASFLNAVALLAQFNIKQNAKKRTEFVFQPFQPLENLEERLNSIKELIKHGQYTQAEDYSRKLMDITLDGLRYYQTYDWLLLRSIVTLGYLGWIGYSSIFILKTYSYGLEPKQSTDLIVLSVTGLVFSALSFLLFLKEASITYYAYLLFPVFFWVKIMSQMNFIRNIVGSMRWSIHKATLLHLIGYLVALEFLVLSYFYRELLTLCLLVMGFVWPLALEREFTDRHSILLRSWKALCFFTSFFTVLPVDLEEQIELIMLGGCLIIISGFVALIVLPRYIRAALPSNSASSKNFDSKIFLVQVMLVYVDWDHFPIYGCCIRYFPFFGGKNRPASLKRHC